MRVGVAARLGVIVIAVHDVRALLRPRISASSAVILKPPRPHDNVLVDAPAALLHNAITSPELQVRR
jgi:hypothetical protein